MNRATPIVLLLAVLGIGVFIWSRKDQAQQEVIEDALFADVEQGRIKKIFFDNVPRFFQLCYERDSVGQWVITDPIAYPAELGQVRRMLEAITTNTVTPVPEAELELARRGLESARVVLEVEELFEDGETRVSRVEIGELDLDGNRVFVKTRGKIYRTLRNVDSMLQLNLADYRSRKVFDIDPRQVVEVRREGTRLETAGSTPLELAVRRQGPEWWMDKPYEAKVDRDVMGFFVTRAASLRVEKFIEDAPGTGPQALRPFGLDRPDLRIELTDNAGRTQVALFAQDTLNGAWLAKLEDKPYIWEMDRSDPPVFMRPSLELLDHRLLRTFRGDVERIRLRGAEREVLLAKTIDKRRELWTVAERALGAGPSVSGEAFGTARRADESRVKDLLSLLEGIEITRYLRTENPAARFPPNEPPRGIWVEGGGVVQGGHVGELHLSDGEPDGLFYRREGENIVSLVPVSLQDPLGWTARDLQSPLILELSEVDLRELRFDSGERTRRYVRDRSGVWRLPDAEQEATELRAVLDSIFFLRASEHLSQGDLAPLAQVVGIAVQDDEANVTRISIGLDAAGIAHADVGGLRSVLKDQGLHAKLAAIVRGDAE